jgi:ATP-dependent RNA helicase HelY
MFVDGRPNREAARIDESAVRFGPRRHDRHRNPGRRRLAAPSRVEVVDLLRRRDMLPAICFIFSRAQCDAAAVACLDAGVRLTSADERRRIHEILDERLGALEPEDLDVLGYASFVARLDAGIASHHAGMVPPMKEVVEACFVEGLVKVVFATETLAVGINMPARTVVIEQLTKFNGDHHERLSPGAYTQLTGRAGRRGIDARGSAVVLWSPWVRFDDVARLASSTAFDLRSVFRPTYNMSANLVRVYTSEEAHHLLNLSFAQYQADREVVRIEARLERKRAALAAARVDATSPYGDVGAYRRARAAEAEATRARRAAAVDAIDDALERLRPGMVISVRAGRHRGDAVVTAHTHRKGVVRLTLLMRDGDVVRLTGEQFDLAPRVLGRLTLPPNFSPNRRDDRAQLVRRLRTLRTNDDHVGTASPSSGGTPAPDQLPVARDPDLRQRIEADATAERLDRDVRDLEHRVGARNQSLARDFDRVLRLLDARGYVDLGGWRLTERGEVLARVFHECDLLVAEVLFDGVLDGVDAADLAALVSTLVYEHRSADPGPPPWFSSRDVRDRFARIAQLSADLERDEARLDAPSHRAPDATFAAVAYAWVAGEGFAEVVADEELTGGDFVRTVKQLIDLLRQIALLAPTATTRRTAAAAAEAAHRGVVADAAVASASTGSA